MGGVDGALQDTATAPSFKEGHCCTTQNDDPGCLAATVCAAGSGFCASGAGGTNPINNRFLKEFMWPSDATNCPDDTNVVISATGSGNAITKKHDFAGVLPNSAA